MVVTGATHSRERGSKGRVRRPLVFLGIGIGSLVAALTLFVPAAGQSDVLCNGLAATIVGTDGRDVIWGTSGRDVVAGLGGNDVVRGLDGDDVICGGEGRDRLFGGRGDDVLFGGERNDILKGDQGGDHLFGNAGRDRLVGGGGRDLLEGGAGFPDRLVGKGGVDRCSDPQARTARETCEVRGRSNGQVCSWEGGALKFGGGARPPACWRPYGELSPFNKRIPASPVIHRRSDEIVARTLGLGPINPIVVAPDTDSDWFHPVFYSTPADPSYTIRCTNPDWGRCEIEGMVVRIPEEAKPAAGGDAHLAIVEQHTGWEYDFWKVEGDPRGGGTIRTEWGGRTRLAGDGLRSDATAAHFGLQAGIIRFEELIAGRIDHALFLFIGCAADDPVPPATGNGAECDDPRDAPAIGQLFWLDMTAQEIESADVAPWTKTILRALAEYGGYAGDTGGNEAFALQFESATSYTGYGQPNPWLAFTGQRGVSTSGGALYFEIADAVDWASRLKVLDPCVVTDDCAIR